MKIQNKLRLTLVFISSLLTFSYCYCESIKDEYIPIVSISFPNHPEWKNWKFVAYQEKKKDYFLSKPVQLWAISSSGTPSSFFYIAQTQKYNYNYLHPDGVQLFNIGKNVEAFLFTPIFCGGGSGQSQLLSLLVPDIKKAKWKNLLPEIYITNLGEWQFLKCPLLSQRKILVTADFIFSEGETHYSSHKYRIRLYNYSEKEQQYKIFDEYETKKKYNSLEGDITPIAPIIEQEMEEILLRLKGEKLKR